MARKARAKSVAKAGKKRATRKTAKRKAAAKKRAKPARRKATRKGLLAELSGGFEAVIDTLSEAERLHRRLEPRPSLDREPE